MRICDPGSDKVFDNIMLYLTIDEARELHNDLADLIDRPAENHAHINSFDYQQEITISIYDVEKT